MAVAVCGDKPTSCTNLTDHEASKDYELGPPYILLHEDIKKLAPSWQVKLIA